MNGDKMVEDIKKLTLNAYADIDDAHLPERVRILHGGHLEAIDKLCDLVARLYNKIERLESE